MRYEHAGVVDQELRDADMATETNVGFGRVGLGTLDVPKDDFSRRKELVQGYSHLFQNLLKRRQRMGIAIDRTYVSGASNSELSMATVSIQ